MNLFKIFYSQYTVCLPDYEAALPELSQIIQYDYVEGAFSEFEDAFVDSEKEEDTFTVTGRTRVSLDVTLEQYEGYFSATLRGSGRPFKDAKVYLWNCYVKAGGNLEAQEQP